MQSRCLSRLAMAAAMICLAMPASAQQTAPPPAVLVQPAESRAITLQAEFVGRADALEKVEIRARVRGFLGSRLFKDGELVKKEQVIFTIEKEPFEATVDQRKAQLASAQATFNNADIQLQRGTELTRTGAMPPAQLDQRRADRDRAKASILEAEAALRLAEIELSYTEIKSPIDGRIGRAAVSPGNLIGPDSGVLVSVVQEDPMEVLFSVSQREMLEARRGTDSPETLLARIKLSDGSIYPEIGHLDFVDVQANPQTDGQIVRAMFPNPKEDLVTGQTVRVIIEQKAGEQTVVIPQAAIAIDQTGSYVFIVGADNVVEQRQVRLGAAATA
jgi:membrane fusion protein (multidrug efflux system)